MRLVRSDGFIVVDPVFTCSEGVPLDWLTGEQTHQNYLLFHWTGSVEQIRQNHLLSPRPRLRHRYLVVLGQASGP